jgi:hypothetical protein
VCEIVRERPYEGGERVRVSALRVRKSFSKSASAHPMPKVRNQQVVGSSPTAGSKEKIDIAKSLAVSSVLWWTDGDRSELRLPSLTLTLGTYVAHWFRALLDESTRRTPSTFDRRTSLSRISRICASCVSGHRPCSRCRSASSSHCAIFSSFAAWRAQPCAVAFQR